ncbi:MAG: M23 family metallopeptidase [Rhizobiaceae bacterium]|nr:M23 family metallopeptidase [Rhizobiaceae bacterium]
MHSIDDSFRQKKAASLDRRRRRRQARYLGAAGAFVVAALAIGFYVTADQWSIIDVDENLVEVDDPSVDTDVPVYVPAIIDLAGDPMTISIGAGSGQALHVREVPRPGALVDPRISPRIAILSDVMLSSSERLMTTIPSSPEDFAFFQAQRTASPPVPPANAPVDGEGSHPDAPDPVDTADFSDPGAGWGETLDEGTAPLPEFQKTRIENNTSVAIVIPERERVAADEDFVDKVLGPRTLESLAVEHGFPAEEGRRAGEALKALFGKETLDVGYVVAMRGSRIAARAGAPTRDRKAVPKLTQVSIYADATYVGTLALDGSGSYVAGVDPWVREDLLHYSGQEEESGPKRQYRLLDAIYSTAVRNSVPTGVIGEAIMFLSRGQDLNAFATQGDQLVLVYSETGRSDDGAGGRVLYAAVRGAQKNIECFVFKAEGQGDFACVTEQDQVYSLTVTNGMVTPVNGVMTSTFGPRLHPILKTVRVHKGVDWAAPTGTPIMAAFDGTIAFHGDGQGYGNVVRISHPGGRETRYAHMSRFAAGLTDGQAVKAGDVIGYIGTTGLSTGPHLHFELYQNGQAINPLESPVVAAVEAGSGDEAVETLVDRIIHVESGGSATAKNPLSSATGLGQFIDGTWLRMIATYRPDLARTLERGEILKLRFDPTISREMVRRLAQEGEAYLRARGHQITAGRLYLCHFLGMEGAATVLASNDGAALLPVLGQGVMTANPFLNGKTVADLKDWAERKMRGRGARSVAPAPPKVETTQVARASPEFVAFKTAILAMLDPAAVAVPAAAPAAATDPAETAPPPEKASPPAAGGDGSGDE